MHETSAIFLANSMLADYNSPNEKSAQIRYETDWSYYGVPGLSTGVWYVKGWDIDGTTTTAIATVPTATTPRCAPRTARSTTSWA